MKGRPILGLITGFLFGLFLGIALFLYGVIPLNSDLLWILPLLGILLGLVMAAWAPFGKSMEPAPVTVASQNGEGPVERSGDVSTAAVAEESPPAGEQATPDPAAD